MSRDCNSNVVLYCIPSPFLVVIGVPEQYFEKNNCFDKSGPEVIDFSDLFTWQGN